MVGQAVTSSTDLQVPSRTGWLGCDQISPWWCREGCTDSISLKPLGWNAPPQHAASDGAGCTAELGFGAAAPPLSAYAQVAPGSYLQERYYWPGMCHGDTFRDMRSVPTPVLLLKLRRRARLSAAGVAFAAVLLTVCACTRPLSSYWGLHKLLCA